MTEPNTILGVAEKMIDVDALHSNWKRRHGEKGIKLKYPFLRGLHRWFLKECERRGVDPETIDFAAIVDCTLGPNENKGRLLPELEAAGTGVLGERHAEEAGRWAEQIAEKAGILDEYKEELDKLRVEAARGRKRLKKIRRLEREIEELRKRAGGLRVLEEFSRPSPTPTGNHGLGAIVDTQNAPGIIRIPVRTLQHLRRSMLIRDQKDISKLPRDLGTVRVQKALRRSMVGGLLARCPDLRLVILTNTARDLTSRKVLDELEEKNIKVEVDPRDASRPVELTCRQVERILLLRNQGRSYREIAASVGCSHSTVANVVRNRLNYKRWRHEYRSEGVGDEPHAGIRPSRIAENRGGRDAFSSPGNSGSRFA